jgi:putative tryptophan/tyrosine transport system substrate-binding protein
MTRCSIGLLVTLALGLLVAPLAADAQPRGDVRRIGLLTFGHPPVGAVPAWEAFRDGLRALGWVEGQNLVFEERFAEGQLARVVDLAHEFVTRQVEVIVAPNARTAARVQQVTRTVPIVVAAGGDLVVAGLVASLAKPGGNVTGVQIFQPDTAAKRVELIREAVPQLARIGLLFVQPGDPRDMRIPDATRREAEPAARAFGIALQALGMPDSPDAFPETFAALAHAQVGAVMVHANPFLFLHRATIAALALEHRLPTIMEERGYVEAGGLMSYGPNVPDLYRRAATYVDKILKGAKPADLPVEQPMTFDLVINLKTADALGLTIPPTLLFQATEILR